MDFPSIMKLARQMMNENGLQYASLKEMKSRRALGRCHQSLGGAITEILLSSISLPLCSDEEIINTIRHEMAHAIVGVNHGHDNVWRRKHIELGGNGERTYSMKKEQATTISKFYKYIGTCPNGHQHPVQRLPKREHSCGLCSRKFDRRYIITYKLNTHYCDTKIAVKELEMSGVSNLIKGDYVTNSAFGDGVVVSIDGKIATVDFNGTIKRVISDRLSKR